MRECLWVQARMWVLGAVSGSRDGSWRGVSSWTVRFGACRRQRVAGGSFGWCRGWSFGGRGCGECETRCVARAAFPLCGCELSFGGRGYVARKTPRLGRAACLVSARVALAWSTVACPDPLTERLRFAVTSSFAGAF
jgi:hypothetical protein